MTDGSGSEASWSLVSSEGDLVDSDEYSIESDPPSLNVENGVVESNLRLTDDDHDASDYRCISDSENSEDTDMTDVEEIEEIDEPVEPDKILSESKLGARVHVVNDHLYSSELLEDCICLDIRTERRIQIFVIASVLCTLLVGALFGDLYTLQQPRCNAEGAEDLRLSLKLSDQVLSFEPIFDKPPPSTTEQQGFEGKSLIIEDFEEAKEEVLLDNTELDHCRQDLNDAIKTAASNSVLMRYMRSRNIQLETLVQELQGFLDLQRKEIEILQRANEETKQSRLPEPTSLPNAERPTDLLPSSSPLDEERSKPEFCTQTERSFFNMTKAFFTRVATMANSTGLSLFGEKRPEFTKLVNWFQKQTLKVFPRMIENVRSGWRSKLGSYLKRVGTSLALPTVSNLTKPKSVVGAIKKQIKSVFSQLSRSSWLNVEEEEEFCVSNSTCDLLIQFAGYLNENKVFRDNLTPKQADSYVEFLKHIPPRQCRDNSTLVGCERCWWTRKDCDKITKHCNLRRWQTQKKIDTAKFISDNPKVKEIFKSLGWIDSKDSKDLWISETSKELIAKFSDEFVEPPRKKRWGKKEKYCQEDWLSRRGAKRAEHRRLSSASHWLFDRHDQRAALRRNGRASDWLFDRQAQRAALRQH